MMNEQQRAPRWGTSRLGGGPALLWVMSGASGLVLASLIAGLFAFSQEPERRWFVFALVCVCVLPASVLLGWALFVDRAKLPDAVRRPEQSIESEWYNRAAAGTFGDLLLVGGIGATGFAFVGIDAPITLVLAAVLLFAMLSFAIRYRWQMKVASR